MKSAPSGSDENAWRQLFEMGDKLLLQPSISSQIKLLKKEFKRITGAQVEIWLLDIFKPLPSKKTCSASQADHSDLFISSIDISQEKKQIADQYVNSYEFPLLKESIPFGKIRLNYLHPVQLTDEFLEFLNAAGSYIAGILDVTRLSAVKDWRLEQLSLVRSVSFEIARYRNTGELFARIVQLIQDTFQFFFVALYSLDAHTQKLNLQAHAGQQLTSDQITVLNSVDGISLGQGLIGCCAQGGKEIISPNVHSDKRYRCVEGLEKTQSEICLPLIINEQTLGVLEILSEQLDAFHTNDVMVLRILADSAALAIENAELFDGLLEKTWISTVMLQVAEAAQVYDNTEDLLGAVVRILPLLAGINKCAIFMREKNSGEFYLNAHYGFDKEIEPKLAMLPYSEAASSFKEILISKEPVVFSQAFLAVKNPSGKKEMICCKLLPVAAHGKVFGSLLVDTEIRSVSEGEQINDSRQEVLFAVARQVALAVENFELSESREYEAYITTILLQVAEIVAASTDLNETLENIINLLPFVVGVDSAIIYLLDDQRQRLNLGACYSTSWKKQIGNLTQSVKYASNKSLVRICQNHQTVFCQVGNQSPEEWLQNDYRAFMGAIEAPITPDPALMVFPLFIGEETLGFLMVFETVEGFEVREKKIEIIKGVAQQLSIAIQNERLKEEMVDRERIQREMQLAQDIQKTFLPEILPTIQGWDIAVRWRPALQVGGDFYDAVPISEKKYGLVVADVSNKGLPAALYMTVARTLIHAAAQEGHSPVDTLQQVNRLLMENSSEGLFITVFYAILDTDSGELVYANAGHNKPLLLSKNHRDVTWLEKGGMPLGVASPLELENKTLRIRFGDHLVMYTDGVTEARAADGTLFGEDRLSNVVKNFHSNAGGSLIETIDSRIMDFQSGVPAADDVTIVVLYRKIN